MHGMLSLWVLVAAFAVVAGWAAYVSVRLYRACPADRARPQPHADLDNTPDAAASDTGTPHAGTQHAGTQHAGTQHADTPQTVA